MPKGYKFTHKQIATALEETKGFLTLAAKRLGCHYTTIQQYIKKFPELKDIVLHIQESHLDSAEFALLKKINQGDLGAICFYLKCKGKQRGYVERQEITGKNGGDVFDGQLTITHEYLNK